MIAFVGKEAYRGAFNERPELGLQKRKLGKARLYVLPSTSPANRPSRTPSGCAGSGGSHGSSADKPLRSCYGHRAPSARRRARDRPRPGRAHLAGPLPQSHLARSWWATPGRRTRRGRDARRGAPSRARSRRRDRRRARPVRVDARARVPLGGALHPPGGALLRRAGGLSAWSRRRSISRPRTFTSCAGGRSPRSRPHRSSSRLAGSARLVRELLADGPAGRADRRRRLRRKPPHDPADHARSLQPGEVAGIQKLDSTAPRMSSNVLCET